jgi:hypothetical protein
MGFNLIKCGIFFLLFIFSFVRVNAQSFYKEKEPKTRFYQISVGGGSFFTAPRLSYDSLVNEILPVVQFTVGKRVSDHLILTFSTGFQPFSTKEYIKPDDLNDGKLMPVFSGYGYTFDFIPSLSLFTWNHHMSRSTIDFQLGAGLGYLITYRTEKFFFNEKYYEFNLIENGFYFPIKASIMVKMGKIIDIGLEGNFLYTFLDGSRDSFSFEKDSNHFARMSLVFRKLLK